MAQPEKGDNVIAYRTTSGRLIDLWDLPPDHLGTASRLAAFIQSRVQTDLRSSEEALRVEILRSFAFLGLHEDSPADDALGVFVLDLAVRWLSLRREAQPHTNTAIPPWRSHLRARLCDALGLSNWGGKTDVAKQLNIDQSGGSRFTEALASPRVPTDRVRGDLLNYVEHLLDLRTLRLTVAEGMPPDLVGAFGTFLVSSPSDLSYRAQRVLLAVSRFSRFKCVDHKAIGSGWRENPACRADLAWALGPMANEFLVLAVADWLDRLLPFSTDRSSVCPLPISADLCSNPDVCTAFHMGLFDSAGFLPVPAKPWAIYNTTPAGLVALNERRFFTADGLRDAIGRAGEGPFPSPGQRVAGPVQAGMTPLTRQEIIDTVIVEARRLRRIFPLAVWVATGGVVRPMDRSEEAATVTAAVPL